jgi:hypothetical protein
MIPTVKSNMQSTKHFSSNSSVQFQFPLPGARQLFIPTRGIEYKKKRKNKIK